MAGGMHNRGACVAGGMHGRGACVVEGMCGRGHVWEKACVAGGHAWHTGPPRQILRDTVNERAVRILLECIL